ESALRPVANGLAVAADGANRGGGRFCFGQHAGNGGRIAFRQLVACQRRALDLVVAAGVQCQQFAPQRGIEGQMDVGDQPRLRAREVRQYRIDPVEAGTRHQADVNLRAHSSADTWIAWLLATRLTCPISAWAFARKASMSWCAIGVPAGNGTERGLRAAPAMRNS